MNLASCEDFSVALIPARSGSKRIPGKNTRMFGGRPIISYSIGAALESGAFKRIIASTDSQEIAEIAIECGAEAPFLRPAGISGDHATTDEVILHALDWLESGSCRPSHLCCIYPTAPMVRASDIARGLCVLKESGAVSAFSVASFGYNIFRAMRVNGDGRLEMFWPENRLKRSQDLPEAFHDAGQFYWIDVVRYRKIRRLFSEDSVPVFIPRHLVQDIDTEEDWARAELMFETARGLRGP